MATAQQIANNIEVFSPEHRIIRYVVKMWRNRNNPDWDADKFVQRVRDGNKKLLIAKVKEHFVDTRKLMTAEEFDTAVQRGIDAGVLTADLRTTGALLIQVSDLLDAKQAAQTIIP